MRVLQQWHRIIPYQYRRSLERRTREIRRTLQARTTNPNKRFVRVKSLDSVERGSNRHVVSGRRQLSFNLGQYGTLLDSQRIATHHNGVVETGEIYTVKLRDVLFDAENGVICTADNSLIVESILDIRRLKNCDTYLSQIPSPSESKKLTGVYSSIHGIWQRNYFHWMIESLPRLYSLKQWGEPLRLLIPKNLTPLQKFTLEACLPANAEPCYFDPADRWLQADEFVFPSFPLRKHFPFLPYEYAEYIRNRIFHAFDLDTSPAMGDERIYISRMKANHSRLLNEVAVEALLAKYGFRSYLLEDLSFEEQVKLFHRASIVVAPHGAGLTNLLFAGHIHVVELLSRAAPPSYFFLSQILSQNYFYLFPIEFDVNGLPDPFKKSKSFNRLKKADYSVDIAELEHLLQTIDGESLQKNPV